MFALAAVASGVPAAAALAQPALTVSPSTAAQGDTVNFSGNVPVTGSNSCAPGDARITSTADLFAPDGFGPLTPRDANRDFETTCTVPSDTPPGTYRIGVRCGGNVGTSASFEVTQPATTTTTTTSEPDTTTAPSTAEANEAKYTPWIVL